MRIAKALAFPVGVVLAALLVAIVPARGGSDRRLSPSECLLPPIPAPIRFLQINWSQIEWMLSPAKPATGFLRSTKSYGELPGRASDRWFTFSREQGPSYLLQASNDEIRIYRPEWGFTEDGFIPLPLRPGTSWTSHRKMIARALDRVEETATCSTERITTYTRIHATLRVDFHADGEIRQSLWFAPGIGLVQWKGRDFGPSVISRWRPAS